MRSPLRLLPLAFRPRDSARMRNLLKRQRAATFLRRLYKVEVMLGGYAAALKPRGGSGVRDPQIISEVGNGRPDESNVFHAATLRKLRITVNTQNAKCSRLPDQVGSPRVEMSND